MPWQHPDGELVTARLLVWTREAAALNWHYFNQFLWKPALRRAGVPEPKRAEGSHALRHFYASGCSTAVSRSRPCPNMWVTLIRASR